MAQDFDSMVDDSNKPKDFDSMVDDSAKSQPQATPISGSFDSMVDDSEKYKTPGQTLAATAEAVGRGLAGPLAPIAEKLFGVPYSEQRAREEAHPALRVAGEIGGLGAGMLTGTGEAALLGKTGKVAEALSGLSHTVEGSSLIAKIGSSAVKNAAEMAMLQGTDNISAHIMKDPQAAGESALANVGLAAVLGAGGGVLTAGVLSPLWKATVGPKIETGLRALTSRLGGVEGQAAKSTAEQLEAQTGIPMPPAVKAVVNDAPGAMELHSVLNQDDASIAGRKHQAAVNDYESQLAQKSVEALGRTPESISQLPELDKYATGKAQGDQLKSELQQMAKPTLDGYNAFNDKYADSMISNARKQYLAEQIGNKVIDEGWHKANGGANSELAKSVIDDLDKQESVVDLKKYITNLRDSNPYGKDTYGAARDLGRVLHSGLEDTISENIAKSGGKGAEEVANYNQLRQNYSQLMSHFENLDEYLKVGKWSGPESFFKALGDMSTEHGERITDRLSGKNNANILELLKQTPETLNKVKQAHVDKLLSDAVQKAPAGKVINARYIADAINNPQKMSPQIRDLVMTPEQQSVVQGVGQSLDAMSDPTHNFSNTARTIGKQNKGNISPISMIAMLMGHGDAGILSWLGSLGFSEAKPAMKLSMLKFLGSDAPIKAEGFKTMANYLDQSYKGGKALDAASKALFKPSIRVLAPSQMPTHQELMKLDKLVAKNQQNPNDTIQNAEAQHIGHYLPEHQQAVTQTQTTAAGYLASLKPKPVQNSPLDKPLPPTQQQQARYERALSIGQNPLIVLQHVKDGTVQTSDLQDLNAMYPKLGQLYTQAITNEMMNQKANSEPIPYKTRIGMSLMLGQPMDSSMHPASIVAAQPQPKAPQQPQTQGKTKRGTSTLGKSNASYKTASQAAEGDRGNRD